MSEHAKQIEELEKALAETESDLQKIVDLQNPLPRAAVREAVAEQLAKLKARRAALNSRAAVATKTQDYEHDALYVYDATSQMFHLALPALIAEAVPLAIELYEVQRRLSFMEKKYGKIDWEGVITS